MKVETYFKLLAAWALLLVALIVVPIKCSAGGDPHRNILGISTDFSACLKTAPLPNYPYAYTSWQTPSCQIVNYSEFYPIFNAHDSLYFYYTGGLVVTSVCTNPLPDPQYPWDDNCNWTSHNGELYAIWYVIHKIDSVIRAGGGGGGGSVTSFSAKNLNPLFTTLVANPTTTPLLTFQQEPVAVNTVFGNVATSPQTPVFFTPVLASQLFTGQGTIHTVLHGSPSVVSTPYWSNVSGDDIGCLNQVQGCAANLTSDFQGGAGTGATVTVSGSNVGGTITLVTGLGPLPNVNIANVSYTVAFPTSSQVVMFPYNQAATLIAGESPIYARGTAFGFVFAAGAVALQPSTTYIWNFIVTGQ